jgi:hypothetical protein
MGFIKFLNIAKKSVSICVYLWINIFFGIWIY